MDQIRYEDAEQAVGVVFRLTRRRLRLSQRELADLLAWDASAVGRWESGHVSVALGRVDGVLRAMGFGWR
ncbi:MAG TPA: helix-turn-helix domain-containing protein [Ornithinibacter sp.]|nr:helix-turn-helix domain-containing protein [Ornithinibacter sp.]